MVVSSPDKDMKKVDENKKSSFFGSLSGFFYNHTKGIIEWVLSLYVIIAFVYSFLGKLNVYKAMRFAMNPIEIIFIGIVDAIFSIISFAVPFLLVCLILKLVMIKSRKLKVGYVLNKNFKIQILIAFLLSFGFAVLFYSDVLLLTRYSPRLVKSSIEIFVLSFISILFTLTSLYGVLNGVDPVIEKNKK